MSEIRVNIIDNFRTISGDIHGSLGDLLVAALMSQPESIEELENAVDRFISRESDWKFFRSFRNHENFEPWDAGLLIIDLSAKVIMADSTYSYYFTDGTIGMKDRDDEEFPLRYCLSPEWQHTRSIPEFLSAKTRSSERAKKYPLFDARAILFGQPLFEYIAAQYSKYKDSDDEDLFVNIHAEWLMTPRDDLRGKTPREVMLEKSEYIGADLHSRNLQWSFTGYEPPPLAKDSNAYKFAGFGRHEFIMHYDLFRELLCQCFDGAITDPATLGQIADEWLNSPQNDLSGRVPADIIEAERQRRNLTMTVRECVIDDDCPMCQMTAVDYIDTPMFLFFDGSNMEYDRFEFSFDTDREEWEAEQRRMEEFSRQFNENYEKYSNDDLHQEDPF